MKTTMLPSRGIAMLAGEKPALSAWLIRLMASCLGRRWAAESCCLVGLLIGWVYIRGSKWEPVEQ